MAKNTPSCGAADAIRHIRQNEVDGVGVGPYQVRSFTALVREYEHSGR